MTHVPWCMSGSLTRGGGENVSSIPGTYVTRNFTYLVRGLCIWTGTPMESARNISGFDYGVGPCKLFGTTQKLTCKTELSKYLHIENMLSWNIQKGTLSSALNHVRWATDCIPTNEFARHILCISMISQLLYVNMHSLVIDYVIPWKRFPCYWSFVRRNDRPPVDYPHKWPITRASMFSWMLA